MNVGREIKIPLSAEKITAAMNSKASIVATTTEVAGATTPVVAEATAPTVVATTPATPVVAPEITLSSDEQKKVSAVANEYINGTKGRDLQLAFLVTKENSTPEQLNQAEKQKEAIKTALVAALGKPTEGNTFVEAEMTRIAKEIETKVSQTQATMAAKFTIPEKATSKTENGVTTYSKVSLKTNPAIFITNMQVDILTGKISEMSTDNDKKVDISKLKTPLTISNLAFNKEGNVEIASASIA
jgi:hypothetical protein